MNKMVLYKKKKKKKTTLFVYQNKQ